MGNDNSSFLIKLKSNLKSDIEINMVTLNNVDFLLDFEVENLANLFPITYLQNNNNVFLDENKYIKFTVWWTQFEELKKSLEELLQTLSV